MSLAVTKSIGKALGRLFIISGPSGVGKGTLVSAALEALPNLTQSLSVTTRPPRGDDVEGATYHFVSEAEFDSLIAQNELLEWADVHSNRYGTPLREVQKALDAGKDLVLEIDMQGKDQVKKLIPEAFSIFIAPPSLEELQNRLSKRATEDLHTIRQRLHTAELELQAKDGYNAVIVNDDLEQAAKDLIEIITRYSTGTIRNNI